MKTLNFKITFQHLDDMERIPRLSERKAALQELIKTLKKALESEINNGSAIVGYGPLEIPSE
jgi:hypothetical protein